MTFELRGDLRSPILNKAVELQRCGDPVYRGPETDSLNYASEGQTFSDYCFSRCPLTIHFQEFNNKDDMKQTPLMPIGKRVSFEKDTGRGNRA